MSNIVAIVGRPNVGKSTLFNRLVESRKAIVNEESGVTRDRNYGKGEWNGVPFSVIDTGGYALNTGDVFEAEIRKQVLLAIEEADVILFVVDVECGIMDLDQSIAMVLRRSNKKYFLVVNKVDHFGRQYDANEFYALGVDSFFCISSANGSGTGDMLDAVVESFPERSPDEEIDGIPKFTVVGRPNSGKSSLVNALIGEDRNIVTDIAGTTRDSLNTRYTKFGYDFFLVDTAGLRKKNKVSEDVEFYSVLRSIRAIEESDVCILMLDATRGLEAQDLNIFNLAWTNKKGVVILVNKWDLVEKDNYSTDEFKEAIKRRLAPNVDIPIVFVSALTKQRIFKALEMAIDVYKSRSRRIKTSEVNDVMLPVIGAFGPPSIKGKYVKIKYAMQLPTATPCFAFYANLPQYVKEPYKRYLENKIRENFDFSGVPIQIFIRSK